MPNKELIDFIKEARKRGFDDPQIREVLLKHRWPLNEIELAFSKIKANKENLKFKNKVTIYLDCEVLKQLEKRANKNMFTLSEQIEDILRRSAINTKGIKAQQEKLDDLLIGLFSRKQSYKKK
ncbi:MAG: hypothetical protein WC796_05355 [Candidatus Pacearchaeota archaeon]|jgi:hypothetical protein